MRDRAACPIEAKRSRRDLLKMLPLAGAGLMLSSGVRSWALKKGMDASDAVSAALFDPGRLAPTFSDAEVTPFDRFPLNSYLVHDPEVDFEDWRLSVSGLVAKPGDYTLDAIRALPRVR